MKQKSLILLLYFFITSLFACHPKTVQNLSSQPSISHDFDFIIGEWEIIGKRRKQWLSNNNEWIETPATCRIWKHMNGMVVLDEFFMERNGETHIGSNYRIYNKNTKEWTIYWASTAFPDLGLLYQVKGKFENGAGKFYGEENHNGKKVKIRFYWKNENGMPHWEQAYFDEKNEEWETNWVMDFKRI